MAVTGVAQTAAALQAYYTQNGFLGQSEQVIANLFASMAASGAAITPSTVTATGAVTGLTGSFGGTHGVRMVDFKKDGAWVTAVDATPGSSLLGLAQTTAGVNLVGNAASGNTKSDYAQVEVVLPGWYVSGAAITVRLRAKWSTTLLTVSSKVDCEVKVAADGSLGSDICTTAAQQVTTSFANYDFTVTPTGRVPGEHLIIRVALLGDDTGGTVNTAGAISATSLVLGAS